MATEKGKPEENSCVAFKPVDIVHCARCTENKHIRMKRIKIQKTVSKKRYKTRRKGANFLSGVDGEDENEKQSSRLNSRYDNTKLSSKENREHIGRHSQIQKTGNIQQDHREDQISGRKNTQMYTGNDRKDLRYEQLQNKLNSSMRQKFLFQKSDGGRSNHTKHQKEHGLGSQRKEKYTREYISIQYETSSERTEIQKPTRRHNGLINENVNIMENGIFYRAISERRQKNVVKIKPSSSHESSLTESVEVVENMNADRFLFGSNRFECSEDTVKRLNDKNRVTTVKFERTNDSKCYNTSKSKCQDIKLRDSDIKANSYVLTTNMVKKTPEVKTRSTGPKIHHIDRRASSDEDDADIVLKLVQMEIHKQYKNEEAVKVRSSGEKSERYKTRRTVYEEHRNNINAPEVKVRNKQNLLTVENQDQCRKGGVKIIHTSKINREASRKENNNNKTSDSVFEFQVVPISDKEYKKGLEVKERNSQKDKPSIKDCSEMAFGDSDINHINDTKRPVPQSIVDIQDIGVDLHPPHHKAMKFKVVRVPSKRDQNKMVKVGGGWSNINHYYERHEPVRRFEYNRSTDNTGQSFLSFRSHYKFPPKTKHKSKAKKLNGKVSKEN